LYVAAKDVNKTILDFFNGATKPEYITSVVIDDPRSGKPSKKAYGIRMSVAKKILTTRNSLPNKKFTSIEQIQNIRGVGKDTFNDITNIFEIKAILDEIKGDIDKQKPDTKNIIEDLKESYQINDSLRQTHKTRLKKQMSSIKKQEEKANNAFDQFIPSKVSPDLRKSDPTYVSSVSKLPDHLINVIERAKTRLEARESKRVMRVYLDDDMIDDLGLTKNDDGTLSGQADLKRILTYSKNSSVGNEFFMNDSLVALCHDAIEAGDIVNDALTSCNNDDTDNSTTTTSNPSLDTDVNDDNTDSDDNNDELINKKIQIQLDKLISPESQKEQELERAKLSGDIIPNLGFGKVGPADVTSYHDFHNLQIAFEDIWTEIFDEKLGLDGKQLYEEWVNIKEDDDDEEDEFRVITTADQLQQFYDHLLSLVDRTAQNDERFGKVKWLIPEITIKQWSFLDEPTKENLYSLAVTALSKDKARKQVISIRGARI